MIHQIRGSIDESSIKNYIDQMLLVATHSIKQLVMWSNLWGPSKCMQDCEWRKWTRLSARADYLNS